MKEQFDVFISYRRSDGAELAKVVRNYLTSRGLRVFLDTRELIDGQYFDTQLRERLIETPNYVLIATPEAFQFRKGEDWVREEIKLAVSEFKKNPQNRSVIPFVPNGTVFPESGLSEGLEDLPRFNRILLKDTKPTGAELLRLAKAICRVNRRNMWNAGQRVLERSKAEGSRFHLLHVDERIMPLYKKDKRAKAQGATLPINVTSGESKEESSLRDALQEQQGSLYLIGEGGIGKTTAMISIMERHYTDQSYSDSGEIPIFVELNGAPKSAKWYQGADGLESDFIRREIARLFLGVNSIGKVLKDYISGMDALFTEETDTPEYLLLLDGLNEVSTDYVSDENGHSQPIRSLIIEEINYLLTECPNVRVMLTSRTDETEINCAEHGIEKLYLTGLHKDSITDYLESKKFSSREIKDALADERLFDCIRIPLFLTMFAALNKSKGVSSRGEIFSRFFHERSDELQSEYTQKNRLDSLKKDTVNKGQLRFILDFLLPAIGCEMERRNDFKMTAEEAAKIILPLLEGKDANGNKPEKTAHPCTIIGEYGKQCFSGYKGSASLPKIAASLLAVSGNMAEVAEYILTSAVDILGFLNRDDNAEYGFIHHHFRDYFAAVHDINFLRIAVQANTKKKPDLAFESLTSFTANANHLEKSIFIGEILGEQYNTPILKDGIWQYKVPISPEDRNLLKRALDILRGKFGEKEKYGVYNLIEPIKLVRNDLSGEDLSHLDLSQCTFYGERLGVNHLGAIMEFSKIDRNNLFAVGHTKTINCVSFSPNGKYLITASDDLTVKVWSSDTYLLLATLKHNCPVQKAFFSSDNLYIITIADRPHIWDAYSYDHINENIDSIVNSTLNENTERDLQLSIDLNGKKKAIVTNDSSVIIKHLEKNIILGRIGDAKEKVLYANYTSDGKNIITVSGGNTIDFNTINIWDSQSRILMYSLHNRTGLGLFGDVDTTNHSVAMIDNDKVTIYDLTTGKILGELNGHLSMITCVTFGYNYIATTSFDHTVILWDSKKYLPLMSFQGHSSAVVSACFSPDNRYLATASLDNTICLWNLSEHGILHFRLKGHLKGINSVCFSPDGKYIVTSSNDGTVRLWRTDDGNIISVFEHNSPLKYASCSSNGRFILSASSDGKITVWDSITMMCLREFTSNEGIINTAFFSRNGKNIITASDDGTVRILDPISCKIIDTIPNYPGLQIIDCNMRDLNSKSCLTHEDYGILVQYGAVINY